MSRPVDDIDVGDLITLPAYQCRQETVQPIEIRHRQKHLAAECLQSATGIARAVIEDRIANRIGGARLQLLESGVLASDALAGDETNAIAALPDRRNQVRQERRIVLAVAVESRDDVAARG